MMARYAVARLETAPFDGRAVRVVDSRVFPTRHARKEAAEAEAAKRLIKAKDLPAGVSFSVVELPELSLDGERDRRAAMAEFTGHCGVVSDTVRRWFVGLLIGKDHPSRQMKTWDNRRWERFRQLMTQHGRECPGSSECPILAGAKQRSQDA